MQLYEGRDKEASQQHHHVPLYFTQQTEHAHDALTTSDVPLTEIHHRESPHMTLSRSNAPLTERLHTTQKYHIQHTDTPLTDNTPHRKTTHMTH